MILRQSIINNGRKTSSVNQSALRGCVFVLKFGWRVCRTFRKLYPAALAFQ